MSRPPGTLAPIPSPVARSAVEAQLRGDRWYIGRPCRTCGSAVRQARDYLCVACVRARSRRSKGYE